MTECPHCRLLDLFRRGAEALTREWIEASRPGLRSFVIWARLRDWCALGHRWEQHRFPVRGRS